MDDLYDEYVLFDWAGGADFFSGLFSFAPANAVVSTGLVIISGTLQSRTRKFSMVRPSLNRFRSKRHLRGMKTRMRCPMSNS